MDFNKEETKLGVIGCGKMANAILSGIVKNAFLDPHNIFVYDINPTNSTNLSNLLKVQKTSSIKDLLLKTNTILIAVKPFVVDDVLDEIKENFNNHLVMSILAGVKLKKYEEKLKNASIVRIMPNTPALVNSGMAAIAKSDETSIEAYNFVFEFMKNCGEVIKVKEDKMDIITALSGSGPAYYFKIIELMAQSAVKLGLDYDNAILLSAQTALGSAKMVLENDFNTSLLIKNVTTPGGCTEVGNEVLNKSNIEEILDKTIKDTMKKAIELG